MIGLEFLKEAPPQYNYDLGCWQGGGGELITEKKCKPLRCEEAIFIPSFPKSLILEPLPVSKSQERGVCRERLNRNLRFYKFHVTTPTPHSNSRDGQHKEWRLSPGW